MLTAIILSTFMASAEAHSPRNHVHHRSHHVHNRQRSNHCSHVPRGHVWVKDHGWIPRHRVQWVSGHYAGRGHNRHWVPGRFVIKVRL